MKRVAEPCDFFPDECWANIFSHLNEESAWESVSLVCKRFLSISNSSRLAITLVNPSIQVLARLLQRFFGLKKIKITSGDVTGAVLVIARSGLNLEELDLSFDGELQKVCLEKLGSKLKCLKLNNCSVTNSDLVRIANSFPQLEELRMLSDSINNGVQVTDEGIDYVLSKLQKLRSIGLDISHKCSSDKFLISLSSNCVFLEHITLYLYSCSDVTENGISFLNNCHYLNSLVLYSYASLEVGRSFGLKGCSNFPKNLQTLKIRNVDISDEFLYSIAKARIPLTDLTLWSCKGYTFDGLLKLLQSCQALKYLDLESVEFLTNEHMEYLSRFLHNLTTITLNSCLEISDSAFVTLTQKCPFLCRLTMRGTSLGREEYNCNGLVNNVKIKYLDLSSNSYLSPSCVKSILTICPKVEILNLRACFRGNGLPLDFADVLECGSGLVSLTLGARSNWKFTRDVQISMLETLDARSSNINDEVLAVLGKMCPRLVHLNLGNCTKLTEGGVKEVVKSCRRLRFLCLGACRKVNIGIVPWIVSNSPCLTRLYTSSDLFPDEETQKHFLQQGCLVRIGGYFTNDCFSAV